MAISSVRCLAQAIRAHTYRLTLFKSRAVSLRFTDVPQAAGHIYDQTGELVWSAFVDGYNETMQFQRQVYKGQPVITIVARQVGRAWVWNRQMFVTRQPVQGE
jgi:hypothetical protein